MTNKRTFVLDTSVLLSDPRAIFRFGRHEVVLPIVVVSELESKRNHPELGYFARSALRLLDDLRVEHGYLDETIQINDEGGTLFVDLNNISTTAGYNLSDNDSKVLSVALSLREKGSHVTLISKDLPMRIRASARGLKAEEYRAEWAVDSGWTGMDSVTITQEQMSAAYENDSIAIREIKEIDRELPCHTGVVLRTPNNGSALGRVTPDKHIQLIHRDKDVFGVRGRSAEQKIAIDLLTDPEIGIVSLGGKAGTGKSILALCAGLEAVMEKKQHKKVMVFRPLYSVGGQDLGYLPGGESEKMNPWAQAVFDTLEATVSKEVVDEIVDREMLEVLPLTHIRGRSLQDAFVIVDEAQSLERNVLLTVLSRIGQDSRVVLTHDVAQRDNLRVGRHDGVASVIEALKGHPLFAHITLVRSERSAVAALVTEMLDGFED
jgi:PhoH-like ATPase